MASTDSDHGVTPATHSSPPSISEKYPLDEKNEKGSSSDEGVDVVVVGEDEIRESGMCFWSGMGNYVRVIGRVVADKLNRIDYTPEEYKKLLGKIDRYLLPLMYVLFLLFEESH